MSSNIVLTEYETHFEKGISLSTKDRRLRRELEHSQKKTARLIIEEGDGGLLFKASYWVGVAHFENFSVEIKPKLVGSENTLLGMLAFSTHSSDFRAFPSQRTYQAQKNQPLVEWFAGMLADACQQLLMEGLLSDYLEKEELSPALRGRILYDQQIMKRFGVVDKIYCKFDEREHDIIENQILLMGLSVAYRLVSARPLRRRIRILIGELKLLTDSHDLELEQARRLSYHRLNQRYQDAHSLCFLLIDNAGIPSFYDSGDVRGTSFFLNMIALFEHFVTSLTKMVLGKTYIVNAQSSDKAIIKYANDEPYREIRPDLMVQKKSLSCHFPIDAKYKLYSGKKISTADVYQLSFYARAYNLDHSSALIIYPKKDGHKIEHLKLYDREKRGMGSIVALGVDVPKFLECREVNQIYNAFNMADSTLFPDRNSSTNFARINK